MFIKLRYKIHLSLIMNGIFVNYLRTMYWSVFGLMEWVRINILNYVFFPAKMQISKLIDVSYIHVYVWFKDDKHVIWMWIWLILKHISLLDIIWSLWLVCFAQSPKNFIFWLNRLIFSVSINSHSDNIYPTVTSARSCNKIGHLFWFTILAQHETNHVILYIHGVHKHRGNSFQRQNYKMRLKQRSLNWINSMQVKKILFTNIFFSWSLCLLNMFPSMVFPKHLYFSGLLT